MSSDVRGGAEFEGGPIVTCVELTEGDFRAVWSVLPRNRRALIQLVFSLSAIPVFWLMVAVLDPLGWSGLMSWPVVTGSFVFGVLGAFGLWQRRFMWAQTAAKQTRNAGGVEFRFDSVGVALMAGGEPSQHEWSSLYRCVETADVFAIFTAPAMVMAVPKRAFAPDELTRLRALLLKYVPQRASRGPRCGGHSGAKRCFGSHFCAYFWPSGAF